MTELCCPSPRNDLDAFFWSQTVIIAPVPGGVFAQPDRLSLLPLLLLGSPPLFHQEHDPVLQQVDVPHRFYYREMYLPQLTSAASLDAGFAGAGVFDGGSLWRQRLDSTAAEQLTAGSGYDFLHSLR